MLKTIIYKNDFDAELYSDCALWANNNNAELVENEAYYVVQAITPYESTKEEKINAIKAEYEPRFKVLEEAQRRLLLMGKPTNAISAQYIKLNSEMVARIKEVQ